MSALPHELDEQGLHSCCWDDLVSGVRYSAQHPAGSYSKHSLQFIRALALRGIFVTNRSF